MVPYGIVELLLREGEHVVPQAGLEVGLHLRQVEVRPDTLLDQGARIVEDVETEIDEGARHGLAVQA